MEFTEFHFIRPQWFWAFPWLILIAGIWLRKTLGRGDWASVCDERLLPYIVEQQPERNSRVSWFLFVFAALLSLIALAGPTWERLPAPAFRNESALVIVLDLSRSMDAQDIRPSRLERARFKISDLLQQRKDGLTALVVYSNEAFTVAPLTDDIATISSQLPALEPSIMPAQGSRTSKGLTRAIELLKQSGNVHGNILLIGDHVDDEAFDVATELKRDRYRLFVLGIGSTEGAPIPVHGGGFLKDSRGNIVVAKLETKPLVSLARSGGGFYKSLTIDDGDIRSFLSAFDEVRDLPSSDQRGKQVDQWADGGPWLLLLVLPIAAFAFRRGYLLLWLVLIYPFPQGAYAFQWNDLWNTPDQQGYSAFEKGNYEKAAELFEDTEWKAAALYKAGNYQKAFEALSDRGTNQSPYNKGNALARSGRLQEALDAYNEALERNPGNEDARFNRDLVEQVLKQQEAPQNQSSENEQASDKKQDSEQNQQNDASGDPKSQQNQPQAAKPDPSNQEQKSAQSQNSNQPNSGEENATEDFAGQQNAEQEKNSKSLNPDEPESPSGGDQPRLADSENIPQQELQQANEQWLRRIPDDPGGLLRRKFKYQYRKNRPRLSADTEAW